jgi:hypothetical protein
MLLRLYSSNSPSDLVTKIDDSLSYVNKADVKADLDVVGKSGGTVAANNDTVTLTITLRNVPSFVPGLITVADTVIGEASMRYE